jgi:hypothetical protein
MYLTSRLATRISTCGGWASPATTGNYHKLGSFTVHGYRVSHARRSLISNDQERQNFSSHMEGSTVVCAVSKRPFSVTTARHSRAFPWYCLATLSNIGEQRPEQEVQAGVQDGDHLTGGKEQGEKAANTSESETCEPCVMAEAGREQDQAEDRHETQPGENQENLMHDTQSRFRGPTNNLQHQTQMECTRFVGMRRTSWYSTGEGLLHDTRTTFTETTEMELSAHQQISRDERVEDASSPATCEDSLRHDNQSTFLEATDVGQSAQGQSLRDARSPPTGEDLVDILMDFEPYLTRTAELSAEEIALLLHRHAIRHVRPSQELFDALCTRAYGIVDDFTPGHIAMLLSACAQLEEHPGQEFFEAISRQTYKQRDNFTQAKDIADVLWSCAVLTEHPGQVVVHALCERACGNMLQELTLDEVSNIVWACAVFGCLSDGAQFFDAAGQKVNKILKSWRTNRAYMSPGNHRAEKIRQFLVSVHIEGFKHMDTNALGRGSHLKKALDDGMLHKLESVKPRMTMFQRGVGAAVRRLGFERDAWVLDETSMHWVWLMCVRKSGHSNIAEKFAFEPCMMLPRRRTKQRSRGVNNSYSEVESQDNPPSELDSGSESESDSETFHSGFPLTTTGPRETSCSFSWPDCKGAKMLKRHHLELLGYTVVMVSEREWSMMLGKENEAKRDEYVRGLLQDMVHGN